MADPRTRSDVWTLTRSDEWHPTLLWYARAVDEMRRRPIADPTSWRYQAAIHRYVVGADPLQRPGDVLPTRTERDRFWSRCQHNSWYFLPWHRMYLATFEQIVAATVEQLGGPPGWSLPYWNYSVGPTDSARQLPPAFRVASLPDGSPNALSVASRDAIDNQGNVLLSDVDVALTECLSVADFPAVGGAPGFGGGMTGFNHIGGIPGEVDRVPHGAVHGAVGGWMGAFNTAGLDPVFWLHHANVDRLWTVWLGRDTAHRNPTQAQWLTGLSFEFHDAQHDVVSFTSSQVADSRALPAPYAYRYEDESDPLAVPLVLEEAVPRRPAMARKGRPEMVGATEQPIVLRGRPATTRLAVTPPTGPVLESALESAEDAGAASEFFLNIENVRGTGRATGYVVYLNLPEGAEPAQHPELLVGVLPMFGVQEATEEDAEHGGSGVHYVLDAGKVVRTLRARGEWNPDDLRVTFVPRIRATAAGAAGGSPLEESVAEAVRGEEARAAEQPIEVGRVSVYVR